MDFDFSAFTFGGAPLEEPAEAPAASAASRKRRGRGAEKLEEETPAKAKRRQAAEESHGETVQVEVLCAECRKNPTALKQRGLEDFFGGRSSGTSWGQIRPAGGRSGPTGGSVAAPRACGKAVEDSAGPDSDAECGSDADPEPVDGVVFCNLCRRVMQEQRQYSAGSGRTTSSQRLKSYKRMAKEKDVAFNLTDNQALQVMFGPCRYCGAAAPEGGHGITRLRKGGTAHGPQCMGPYSEENVATACAHCNLAKGHHTEEGFVEICRHIATHKGLGEFGQFPERFPRNTSRKSRSCYLADSKTHALTNERFREIVDKPCFYCGKEPGNGHFNGLDRLDSTMRVYTTDSCVACCGTCNIMKYRWTVQEFLKHCKRVALHAVGELELTGVEVITLPAESGKP